MVVPTITIQFFIGWKPQALDPTILDKPKWFPNET